MTMIELITQALRKINVINQIEAPTAEQGQQAVTTFNQMMEEWRVNDAIDIGYYPITEMATELPIELAYQRAVVFNLATCLAADYGITPNEACVAYAQRSYEALCRGVVLTFEADMTMLPVNDGGVYQWPMTWQT